MNVSDTIITMLMYIKLILKSNDFTTNLHERTAEHTRAVESNGISSLKNMIPFATEENYILDCSPQGNIVSWLAETKVNRIVTGRA